MDIFGMDGNTHPYETVDGRTVYGKPPECQCEHCKFQRANTPRRGDHMFEGDGGRDALDFF